MVEIVQADGQLINGPGPQRLMMFQEAALFPWLTVLGNVLFGLKLVHGLSASEQGDLSLADKQQEVYGLVELIM